MNNQIKKNNNFRLCSKSIFLTFSRCDLSPTNLKNQISNKIKEVDPENRLLEYLITVEDHEESLLNQIGTHVHLYLNFVKKIDIKNSNFFDVKGYDLKKKEEKVFHPHVESTKNKRKVIEYLLKHVKKDEKDEARKLVSPALKIYIEDEMKLKSFDDVLIGLAEAGEIDTAMDELKRIKPGVYMRQHVQIKQSLKAMNKTGKIKPTKYQMADFKLTDSMIEVIDKAKTNDRMLYLLGASGTGKTQLLLTLIKNKYGLNPAVISNLDGMRTFDEKIHTAILYNDFNWGELKNHKEEVQREKLIHLIDFEVSCTMAIKHGSLNIPEGIPRFAAANHLLEKYIGEMANLPEISRRICYLDIGDSMLF